MLVMMPSLTAVNLHLFKIVQAIAAQQHKQLSWVLPLARCFAIPQLVNRVRCIPPHPCRRGGGLPSESLCLPRFGTRS